LPNEKAHGIQIVNTCAGIAGAGVEVELCTPFFFGAQGNVHEHYQVPNDFVHRKLLVPDIPWAPIRFHVRLVSFALVANAYILYRIILNLFSRKKLVVYVRAEIIFALYFISYLCPVVFETHQIRNHEKFYKILLKRVQGIVVITNALKEKFVISYGLPAAKILMTRDAVDVEKFRKAKKNKDLFEKLGLPTDKKIVMYCGSLTKAKGVYTLADAAAKLASDYVVVFIGGEGEVLEKFRHQYDKYTNVYLVGQVAHEKIPSFVASADVLVQPDLVTDTYARYFTSPMKLFEYMASGRPIVAADVPSVKEVLCEESAIFFKSGDSNSLAKQLNTVLYNESVLNRIGAAAQKKVEEYTWEKRGQTITHFIQKLLS
jgi:glycosyltransferase involved in cell wall biosynthesis